MTHRANAQASPSLIRTYPRAVHALAICLAVFAAPASAAPLDGAAFEAYVTGKTLYFGSSGRDYGAEEYLDNRRVRWSFLDGECKEGAWYEQTGQSGRPEICFVYDDAPDRPQCWTFETSAGGLRATFVGESGTLLYEARQSAEPLYCLGPEIGV